MNLGPFEIPFSFMICDFLFGSPFGPIFALFLAFEWHLESNFGKKICFWLICLYIKPVLLPNYAFCALGSPIWLYHRFWSLLLHNFDQYDLHNTLSQKLVKTHTDILYSLQNYSITVKCYIFLGYVCLQNSLFNIFPDFS